MQVNKAEHTFYLLDGQYWVRIGHGAQPAVGPFGSLEEAVLWTKTRHRQSREA